MVKKTEKNKTRENVTMNLGSKIGKMFIRVLQKVLIVVCLGAVLIGGFFAVRYTIKDSYSSAKEYTEEIDRAMQGKISMVEAIAAGISSGTLTEHAAISDYVDAMVAMDDQISAVYSCYNDNTTIMSGGWEPPADFVVTDRAWYLGAQAQPDQVYISDPYVDEQSGGICITLAKATYQNGEVAGVVGMDMYMDNLVSLMEGSYQGSSYVFLTTNDGTILVHPHDDYSLDVDRSSNVQTANGGRYEAFTKKDLSTGLFLDYAGGLKIGIGNTSAVTGWKVIAVKPIYSVVLSLVLILGLNILIYAVAVLITGKKMNRKVGLLFRPLETISDKMGKVAQGDLSVVFDEEKNSLEIERLTDSINETITSLNGYIASISKTVTAISDKDLTVSVDGEFKGSYVQIKDALESIIEHLNESFALINEQAESVLEYAEKLEMTTQTVAQSAADQNESVVHVSQNMVRLTEQTRQITEHAVNVRSNVDVTNEHLAEGNREMSALVDAMEGIDRCYTQIAEFVDTIKGIAAKTNLLSLNASIEAARAGEAGRGFAVVADEISTLAASSAQASENINKLIEESRAAVSNGKQLVNTTSLIIEQGVNDSVQSKQHIDEIVEFVEKQQNAIEDINAELKDVAGIVENNAASAQENTAISQQLNECAQNLKHTAGAFTLK